MTKESAVSADAVVTTIEDAIARLQTHRASMGYLPSTVAEEIAALLFGSARLGRWSRIAKALYDQGAAIALYASLFPGDRWMLGYRIYGATKPAFEFAVFPPYAAGDEKDETLTFPHPFCETTHDICGIAIVLAALHRRAQEPLSPASLRTTVDEAKG
jgi:hypothetical protein